MWFTVVYQHVWLPVVCVHVLVVHVSDYVSCHCMFNILFLSPSLFPSPFHSVPSVSSSWFLLPLEVIVSDIQTQHSDNHMLSAHALRHIHEHISYTLLLWLQNVEMSLNLHGTLAYVIHNTD